LESPPVCNGEIVSGCGNQGTHGSLPARVSGSSNVVPDGTYGQALGERPRPDQIYKDTRPRNLLISETQIDNSQGEPQNPPPNTVCLQTQAITVSVSTIPDSLVNPSEIEETDHPASLSTGFTMETRYTQNTARNIDDLDDGDVSMELESPTPRSPQYHSPEPHQQQVTRADSSINHQSMTVLQVSEVPAQSQITAKSLDHSRASNADPVGNGGTEGDIDSPPYSPRLDDELPDSPVTGITPATTAELPVTGTTTQSAPVTPSLLLQQLTLHQDSQAPPLLSPLSPSSPLMMAPTVPPLQTLLSFVSLPCANCGGLWPMFVGAARRDGRNYWYAQ